MEADISKTIKESATGTGSSEEDISSNISNRLSALTGNTNLAIETALQPEMFNIDDDRNYVNTVIPPDIDLLHGREVFLNEKWHKKENIQGKIVTISDAEVCVDCLIDKEERKSQIRSFPKVLFNHLDDLKVNYPVLIIIKIKAGSSRIDIHSGKGIVDLKTFDSKDHWESLRDSGLDKPLTSW